MPTRNGSAEWKGDPPQSVRDWLMDRGVEL